jgi:hypothetical protein
MTLINTYNYMMKTQELSVHSLLKLYSAQYAVIIFTYYSIGRTCSVQILIGVKIRCHIEPRFNIRKKGRRKM